MEGIETNEAKAARGDGHSQSGPRSLATKLVSVASLLDRRAVRFADPDLNRDAAVG